MGNDGHRVIQIDSISDQLAACQTIQKKMCPVYGEVHYVQYEDMQFYLGESVTKEVPHPMSLHYLVPPNLLVISEFNLLENINPSSLDNLLHIMSGIFQMASNSGQIGIGYGRLAYAGRWGIVGQLAADWPYQSVLNGQQGEGVYLSPQLMISLSQGKNMPKHVAQKSDVFALGVMLVEIIFQEKLFHMFDYQNFQISLKPLLQKLYRIRQEYGDAVYEMFLAMLEIQQQDRANFSQLFEIVEQIRRSRPRMNNSRMNSSTHSKDMQRGNRTPTRGQRPGAFGSRSTIKQNNPYGNNVSPFRARPMQGKRNNQPVGRINETVRIRQQSSRSPLRRDLKINTEFGRQSSNYNNYGGYQQMNNRRPLSPLSRR